ncbi:hypothetical protein [Janthinobacterium aquaticum]|uniref:hypothetical protein n=1 Tax=Janthinobacterium sp. FT58W TaxID=2654254 RepID=UPI00126464C6|nr:hypothetical protein [Janthinobacterium sp. FT58W]KAB8037405.1 hypothetical protein GCM43_23660 [Janthinobacterium sp. FT58W]
MPLTADRNTPYKHANAVPVAVAANVKIYAGALVCANAGGFATPGAIATTLTYLGRSEEFVDNTGGANGARTVLVRRSEAFKWSNSSADPVTQAEFGKTVYVVDDETVAKTSATNTRSPAGRVVGIDADGVWIE